MAVAGATGVSHGAAYTVPSMLLPEEVGGNSFKYLQKVRWDDREKLKSGLCNVVTGKDSQDNPIKIWIDVDKKVIRKILTKHEFPDFRTEQTTTYAPSIDAAVADEDLAFNPPKQE